MSGVYISGIEMPKTYPLTVTIYPDGQVLSETVGAKDIHGKAVPVPPHGDLISRETAKLYHSYLVDERTDIRVPAIPLSVLNVVPTIIPAEES